MEKVSFRKKILHIKGLRVKLDIQYLFSFSLINFYLFIFPDAQRSPSESIPSSVTSSTYRDSDLSPRNEDWRDPIRSYPYRGGTSSSSDSTFTGSRASSRGEDIDQEGGGESSSDFLLSGVEYYDLESIQEFPPTTSSYVTMLEEKTRRFQLVSGSKKPLSLYCNVDQYIRLIYNRNTPTITKVYCTIAL